MTRSYGAAIGIGAALIVLLALLSIAYGSTVIPLGDVIAALARAVGLDAAAVSVPVEKIVVDLRLPRAILAICVGAGLGVVGARGRRCEVSRASQRRAREREHVERAGGARNSAGRGWVPF